MAITAPARADTDATTARAPLDDDASTMARDREDPERVEEEAGRASVVTEVAEGAPWTVIEEAMLHRRSIRKYKRKQVPAHLVRRILEMGRYAPSQGNCQPWTFVVLRASAAEHAAPGAGRGDHRDRARAVRGLPPRADGDPVAHGHARHRHAGD